jgi:hypothetical protein
MPLTDFQRGVARTLARNRTPESHVVGGAVLNRGPSGLRVSKDMDIFIDQVTIAHNSAQIVDAAAAADERLLGDEGYSVEWQVRRDGFRRATIGRGGEHMQVDWATDAAARFFPAQADEDFGYCLHWADLAVNKMLALVDRSEIRDYLDILELDRACLSLGAIMWAACGKDEGYTPDFILELTNRHASYRQIDLSHERLVRPVDLHALKRQWVEARERAANLFARLPGAEIGCLYLDPSGEPVTPDPGDDEFDRLIRHTVSASGSLPTIA